jgi:signal transduction histidine kinase
MLVGVVALLVPALAWMQYQWLGQLSEAERERMHRTLRNAAAQFATEYDSELTRTLVSLQIDGQIIRDQNWSAYAQRYTAWVNSASMPRLVRDVWLIDTVPGTTLPESGQPVPADRMRVRRWNMQAITFEDAEWPIELLRLRDGLAARMIGFQVQRGRGPDTGRRETSLSLASSDDDLLISPVTLFELPNTHLGPPKITILGFTVVRLDPAVIRETMLASLASRHFHPNDDEVNYRVVVVERSDDSKVVWESEPGAAAIVRSSPDVTQPFMGPRPDQMFVFARDGNTVTRAAPPPPPPPSGAGEWQARAPGPQPGLQDHVQHSEKIVVSMVERENRGTRVLARDLGPLNSRWVLMAKHRSGSLEAAVAAIRMRNLLISSGVLMLLTLAVGLIAVSARRAQSLARQQMEFVAAVSHELRTPVSVIGAAAGNLADGVVGDPQRVRKYGETIQGEARRLGETVERVLQLAGIAAGRMAASPTPVSPAALVNDSIAACRHEIDAAGFTVDVDVADALPPVMGDVAALKSALQNLISNAVKYGGNARWLKVSATLDRGTGTRQHVLFAVEDRGLGIDAEDRKHIFEPFYRGREAVSQQIQGSGLGLNLVHRIAEAHGGRVSVISEPGRGSTFTLALPASPDVQAAERDFVNLAKHAPSPR